MVSLSEDRALNTGLRRYAALSSFAFAGAAVLALGVAYTAAGQIEDRTVEAVQFAMREDGLTWVEVSANGLLLQLDGTAPDEAGRFRAIGRALSLVEGDRVVDRLEVEAAASFTAPPFALEILRNDDGISLIGLVPAEGSAALVDDVPDLADGAEIVEMVETANYPAPEGWQEAVDFGLRALRTLPRAKVSVTEGRVEIEAVSRSPEERAEFIARLERAVPDGVEVVLDISAPRPVITPFSLRYVRGETGGRLESCSADSQTGSDRILAAVQAAGVTGTPACDIGLGIPSPRWTEAVELALAATAEIGEATLTFSDADITLVAVENTPQEDFDRIIGELEADLPEVFSLRAVLPEPSDTDAPAGPPSFTAELGEDGQIELRGRLPDATVEAAVEAFAQAEFGHEQVLLATRRVDDLPSGWSVRVLAGLDALGYLSNGSLRVEPDRLAISGNTGSTSAVSDISRLLSERLGGAANFDIDVNYIEALDPEASIPGPEDCVARINAILEDTKITFDPGSVEINEAAGVVLDLIAEVLPDCRHVPMEIGGHTDAQGREEMNLRLSQSRADAVLNGLLARNVLIGNLTARGYGESRPIADNQTDAGREINRRIEFRLIADIEAEQAAEEAALRAEELANLPTPRPRPDRAGTSDEDAGTEDAAQDAPEDDAPPTAPDQDAATNTATDTATQNAEEAAQENTE